LVVSDIDPKTITKVQLYNNAEKAFVGNNFTALDNGFFVYDKSISYTIGQSINTEQISVNIYTKAAGTKIPALSGTLISNRTSFISLLQADETVVAATGTSSNVGFASAIAWSTDSINYFLSVVVNHDLVASKQKVTAIQLSGPAASNTVGQLFMNLPISDSHAGKLLNVPINSTFLYWLNNNLVYINIITSKNTGGALRGQLIPTTTPRTRTPKFPNLSTATNFDGADVTLLPDGSNIQGDVGLKLEQGGARNLTGNLTDDRVALFAHNVSSAFNNQFQFELPVTIKNRFIIRGAVFFITAAAQVADNNKFTVGLYKNSGSIKTLITIPGLGIRTFNTYQINIDTGAQPDYLSASGILINVQATSITGPGLYVDRFFVSYSIVNAYANNILKAIFYKGSSESN